MRVYLSGPITGITNENRHGFAHAKAIAECDPRFTSVINPLEIDPGKENPEWSDYMRADIKALMDCDAIMMLPGWPHSRGAKVEFALADALGMKTFTLEHSGIKP